MRWRRRVEATLREAGLTFTQWLVLTSARELIGELDDAVSQKEIAARVELDRAKISQAVHSLIDKDMLSFGLDMGGKAWRIFLSDRSERLLCELRPRVEAISFPCSSEGGIRDAKLERGVSRAQRYGSYCVLNPFRYKPAARSFSSVTGSCATMMCTSCGNAASACN
jgi:DNA-binding MarR family transcriptional regulator